MIPFKNNRKKSTSSFKVIVVCLLLSGSLVTPGFARSYCYITNEDGTVLTDDGDCTDSLVIDNTVTSIGNNAFLNNSALTSVTIGNSVISIGVGAFKGTALATIIFGDSVRTIGEQAFRGNNHLNSVTIGNSVTSIGDRAFFENNALTSVTIPASVTSIDAGAFLNNSVLASVTFLGNAPASVNDNAFPDSDPRATANVAYNATGFGENGSTWNNLIVTYGSPPVVDSDSSSPTPVVTITPVVVKTADAVFNLKNKKYLSKVLMKTKLSKNKSFKRNPEDLYKYSISKTSKKTCIMRGNYVMAIEKTGTCDLNLTRTTAKGAKYKYWVKINYSN
jgi:hypothetical protein